jgi:hypothetical protein
VGHIKLNSTSSSLVLDVDGDAVLLRALFQRWPEGKFDEASISGNARHSPELFPGATAVGREICAWQLPLPRIAAAAPGLV